MKRINLLGNLPTYISGINKNRLDRKKISSMYGITYNQVNKAYNNWIQIFRMTGSNLTFEQYLDKMKEVNITPDQVGNEFGKYNLSRYNDEGPYTNNSCRFILFEENLKEEKRESIYERSIRKNGKEKTHSQLSKSGRKGNLVKRGLVAQPG